MSDICVMLSACHAASILDHRLSLRARRGSELCDPANRSRRGSLGATLSEAVTSCCGGALVRVNRWRSESTALRGLVTHRTTFTTSITIPVTIGPRTSSDSPRTSTPHSMAARIGSSTDSARRSSTRRVYPHRRSGVSLEFTTSPSFELSGPKASRSARSVNRSGLRSMKSESSLFTMTGGRPEPSAGNSASDAKWLPACSKSMGGRCMAPEGHPAAKTENGRLVRPLLLRYLERVEPA